MLGRDARDDDIPSADPDRRADDAGWRAERRRPESVGEHHGRLGSDPVVRAGEQPAERGPGAEHLEVAAGYEGAFDGQRTGPRRADGELPGTLGADGSHVRAARLQDLEIVERGPRPAPAPRLVDREHHAHEPVAVVDARQLTGQDRREDGEDRDADGDADPEAEADGDDVPGGTGERAEGLLDVGSHGSTGST
jgi:hypothetical protein